jgi:hypothetical protein
MSLAAPRSQAREFKVSSHNLYNYLVCIFRERSPCKPIRATAFVKNV